MVHTFYLGSHQPHWLATAGVPLFISHRRLAGRKTLPRAAAEWALDSGAFSELSLYGQWRTTVREYHRAVRRYDDEIGKLSWAAPLDLMCEPDMLSKTGLSVAEHQRRTVDNFVELQELWDGKTYDNPYMPVIQGWLPDDYLRCVDMYEARGIDLTQYPIVGVGSVCRRQASSQIDTVISAILRRDPDMPLHAFGVKAGGLKIYGRKILTCDSLAWSYQARREPPLAGHIHSSCANCLDYALTWRSRVLAVRPSQQLTLFDDLP